jgi:hypothetical protein
MLLYNNGNTLILLYLDLQSEYNQLSLHLFSDPSRATDIMDSTAGGSGGRSALYGRGAELRDVVDVVSDRE